MGYYWTLFYYAWIKLCIFAIFFYNFLSKLSPVYFDKQGLNILAFIINLSIEFISVFAKDLKSTIVHSILCISELIWNKIPIWSSKAREDYVIQY